jgi:hypothetical protein
VVGIWAGQQSEILKLEAATWEGRQSEMRKLVGGIWGVQPNVMLKQRPKLKLAGVIWVALRNEKLKPFQRLAVDILEVQLSEKLVEDILEVLRNAKQRPTQWPADAI